MDKEDIKLAKKKILKCLTEEFDYGTRKDGQPLKRRKINQPLFIKEAPFRGEQVFNGTDLEMVMDKVLLGLYFALEDSEDES